MGVCGEAGSGLHIPPPRGPVPAPGERSFVFFYLFFFLARMMCRVGREEPQTSSFIILFEGKNDLEFS